MKQPCEMSVYEVLPAIRSRLSSYLIRNGGLKQTEVSKLLGITQAAVSLYCSEKRGDEALFESYPQIRKSIEELGKEILKGLSASDRQRRICGICRKAQNLMFPGTSEK